ncbi:hypothetical protein BBR47_04060 [Brevibacillus brevis NBRC 100599]|uniref:Uncharacterized protein n=1 Tax=Brevibacillus brevis (strain 47 / JCM 6285 / NBRC 100599) TaxID=358681 RepID=C0ZJT2_BREBN|nr:hypothetical protein BBR47_04060 [Brevibacillus brevis NBRC 100599]
MTLRKKQTCTMKQRKKLTLAAYICGVDEFFAVGTRY